MMKSMTSAGEDASHPLTFSKLSKVANTKNPSPQLMLSTTALKMPFEATRSNSNVGNTSMTDFHFEKPKKAIRKMKQSTTLSPFSVTNTFKKATERSSNQTL